MASLIRHFLLILSVLPSLGLILPHLRATAADAALPAGTAIDNSARLEFARPFDPDSTVLATVSNTVTTAVELVSNVDIVPDLDTRFIQTDTDYLFIKRIQNKGNGVDTFVLRVDSTVASGSVRVFIDADADSQLTGADLPCAIPPIDTLVLSAGGETTILISVRLPAGTPGQTTDTISIIVRSVAAPDPSADTGQLVLTVGKPAPSEVTLLYPPDMATTNARPGFVWSRSMFGGSDAAAYIVEISRASDTDFGDTVRSAVVHDTEWTASPYIIAGVYRWHVKAVDAAGNANAGTDSRVFTVDTGTPGRLRVSAAANQPSNTTVQEQDTRVVAVFALAADTQEDIKINHIRLTHIGGMPTSAVSRILMYADAGIPGEVDPADTLFFSGNFGPASITAAGSFSVETVPSPSLDIGGAAFIIPAGETVNVLVVYRIGAPLAEGDTFQVQIVSGGDVNAAGLTSNAAPPVLGLPAAARIFTVRPRYPAVFLVIPHCRYELPPQAEPGLLPIFVKFNVPIDSATVTSSSIRLLDGDGIDRTDSVVAIDNRTVRIKAVYPDTGWPYGTKFFIHVGPDIRDLDVPPDSMQLEFVHEFQTLLNPRCNRVCRAGDGLAELRIDTDAIDGNVKGIAVDIAPADGSDTLLARMLDAMKDHPYLAFMPGQRPIYNYKILKRGRTCADGLIPLTESDYQEPVEVAITVRKPEFLIAKGTPLSPLNLRLTHFKEDAGQWEIMDHVKIVDNGDTVTVCGKTRNFSPYGVLFAFAPASVKETFRAFPNPADPFATYTNPSGSWQGFRFGWNMPKAGAITIRIYDFAGQLVRVLGPTTYTAGDYFAQVGTTWDGRNGLGQIVLNGTYFVRAEIRYTDGSFELATDRIAVVK